MKKYFSFLLCLLFVASFCGCTVKVEEPEKSKNNTNSNTTVALPRQRTATTVPDADPIEAENDLSKSKVIWGPGNIKDHQQPSDPIQLQKQFKNYNAKWLLDNEKSICLTFDEGYENGYTPVILDVLKDKNVKAIFFVTYDFAKDNPQLIQRMIDEGHIVGNHTYRHYAMDEQSEDIQREEILYLHNFILDNYNYTMSYFRFPKGEFSEQALSVTNELGYTSVFWSFAYADWDPNSQLDTATALKQVCDSTHAGEIMLLHAVSKTNAEILGDAIDDVRSQGYEFTTKI